MKRLKRIAYYFVVIMLAVLAGGVLGVYIYKDEIIDILKEEVNKSLKTELEVETIDINFLKGFPNLAVDFKGVKFHSAFANEKLLTADHVYFVLNVIDLLEKDIVIQRLDIENGALLIHTNARGKNNFDVFITSDTTDSATGSLDIQSVQLDNVEVSYKNDINNINATLGINHLSGSAQINDANIEFYVQSVSSLKKAEQQSMQWLVGKNIQLTTKVLYERNTLTVAQSELAINKAQFMFSGNVQLGDIPQLDVSISAENNDFENIVSIMPGKIQNKLAPFNGKGNVNFKAGIKGKWSQKYGPSLNATLHLFDFKINHKQLKEPLYLVDVTGNLVIKDLMHTENAYIILENAEATLKDQPIEVTGRLDNFVHPVFESKIVGVLDVPWLLSVAEVDQDAPASGTIDVNIAFNGSISSEKGSGTISKAAASGTCRFNRISISLKGQPPIQNTTGEVTWTSSGIDLNDFSGQFGKSSFNINGRVRNFIGLVEPSSDALITSTLELESSKIDLDEIVDFLVNMPSDSLDQNTNQGQSRFTFNVGVSIDTLNFKRFRGTNIKARTTIEHNRLLIDKLTANGMGGQMAVAGKIVKQFNNDFFIEANVKTNAIELDSLFFVFNNFQQDFITDKYLKGKLNSNVYASMYFDENWRFRRNLLYSEGLLQIKKGELNDFEPIMALSPYLNNSEEKLSRLRFSDLNSRIDIAHDTVYISDMYVGTNVRNIKIGGYHTLDQHIDYRLSVPVINDNKDKDQKFGEIRQDKEGKLYWPFRIKGTTDDYKVNYDLGRAGTNLVKGIKREVTELGNTLIGKPKNKEKLDTLKLDDDDSFDWDDN